MARELRLDHRDPIEGIRSAAVRAWFLAGVVASAAASPAFAQEIEARRWSHVPIDTNFAAAGYAYTQADIALDPVLRIEGATMEMHTWFAGYVRTFQLFDKSARIDLVQAYKHGDWEGRLNGTPAAISRSGLADSSARLAVNLYGAPPLKDREYAAYRAAVDVETIVGTALSVQFPTGQYMSDKLINLGTNRFTFRPELGVVHSRGPWWFEGGAAASVYTENDDFFGGNRLEQAPLYTFQGHVIYSFRPGLWTGASIGYEFGARSTVSDDEKNDRKETLMWAFSAAYPISRQWGIKAAYIGARALADTGADADVFVVAISTFW